MRISLTVNQQPQQLEVDPRLLLVDVLRDQLGLTSAKVGCDTGQCGACVVLMDGVSVKSCALLGVQADGRELTTLEGLSPAGSVNPLQAAFQAEHAVQCGFCTPGMIMGLTDLLSRQGQPTEQEIRRWLNGNLCRCTGYENVVRAVQTAVKVAQSPTHQLPNTPLRQFYDDLLRALEQGDAEALVDTFYHPNAVLTTFEGIHTGREALVAFFRQALYQPTDLMATERFVELTDSFYVESLMRTLTSTQHTYNSFVVRDGRISHQFAGVK
jgi:carbon-monoxide dehydrogenase small subunit